MHFTDGLPCTLKLAVLKGSTVKADDREANAGGPWIAASSAYVNTYMACVAEWVLGKEVNFADPPRLLDTLQDIYGSACIRASQTRKGPVVMYSGCKRQTERRLIRHKKMISDNSKYYSFVALLMKHFYR